MAHVIWRLIIYKGLRNYMLEIEKIGTEDKGDRIPTVFKYGKGKATIKHMMSYYNLEVSV